MIHFVTPSEGFIPRLNQTYSRIRCTWRRWASADSVEIMDSAPARSAPLKKCFENFMVMVLKPFIDLYEVQFLNSMYAYFSHNSLQMTCREI
jgi:hypothetical protein